MNLLQQSFRPIEFLADRILDPVFAGSKLQHQLAGRSLLVEITDLDCSFLISFHHLGVRLNTGSGKQGNLVLRGTLGAFLGQIRGLSESTLQFEGDLGFAHLLGELVQQLPREHDIWLRALLGAPLGRWLSRTLEKGAPIFQKNAAQLAGFTRMGLKRIGFGVSLTHFSAWQSTLEELKTQLDTLESLTRASQWARTPPP